MFERQLWLTWNFQGIFKALKFTLKNPFWINKVIPYLYKFWNVQILAHFCLKKLKMRQNESIRYAQKLIYARNSDVLIFSDQSEVFSSNQALYCYVLFKKRLCCCLCAKISTREITQICWCVKINIRAKHKKNDVRQNWFAPKFIPTSSSKSLIIDVFFSF